MPPRAATLALILVSVSLNAAAQIFLRLAARDGVAFGARAAFDVLLRPALLAGLACYALSLLTWIAVLSRAEASFAYPFLGLGFVMVAVAGAALLGEAVSWQRVAAIALIVAGVVVLARS